MNKAAKNFVTVIILAIAVFALWQYFHRPSPKAKTPPAARKPAVAAPRTPAAPVRAVTPLPPRATGAGPKIVVVIDDIGNTGKYIPEFRSLGNRVTYAILPLLTHSKKFAELSRETGAETILHLPLESSKGTIPGKGLITTAMPDEDVLRVLKHDLDSVPYLTGLNNHMGSKGTSDPRIMGIILKELKRRGFFFLDSKTTPTSIAKQSAAETGIAYLERDIFLDNIDSPEPIRQELLKLSKIARARGYAIGIGHYRPNTIEVLREEMPKLEKQGFRFVALKDLLRSK